MSKLTLRIRLLTKINSGFRIVFNKWLRNILRAHGNNSVHGIHLPIARTVCVVQQGLEMTKSNEQSGRAISKTRNTGTRITGSASFRKTEHQNTRFSNLSVKIRGGEISGGCEIIAGKIIP